MKIRNTFSATVMIAIALFLQGCNYALLSPEGPVGEQIRNTLLITVGAMLLVVIPTIFMIVYFAHRYSRKHADVEKTYAPDWDHSTVVESIAWGVPIAIIAVLATITYIATHKLDPRRRLSEAQPMVIDVVSLNWKWLFLYPDEKIATVNELAIPIDQPIEFHITSDSTMNSFFIPRLGSQIYAMSGMENRLNLMATSAGVYQGMSANYSGFGFAGMKFKAHALSRADYRKWVAKVRDTGVPLTDAVFSELQKDSRFDPVAYYSEADPGLYGKIIHQFTGVTQND